MMHILQVLQRQDGEETNDVVARLVEYLRSHVTTDDDSTTSQNASAKETKLSIMLRAKILAAEETQRILDLKTELLDLQSDRLHQRELHLKQMQSLLESERRQISKERDAAFLELISARRDRISSSSLSSSSSSPNGHDHNTTTTTTTTTTINPTFDNGNNNGHQ